METSSSFNRSTKAYHRPQYFVGICVKRREVRFHRIRDFKRHYFNSILSTSSLPSTAVTRDPSPSPASSSRRRSRLLVLALVVLVVLACRSSMTLLLLVLLLIVLTVLWLVLSLCVPLSSRVPLLVLRGTLTAASFPSSIWTNGSRLWSFEIW